MVKVVRRRNLETAREEERVTVEEYWSISKLTSVPGGKEVHKEVVDRVGQGIIQLYGKEYNIPRLCLTVSDEEIPMLPEGQGFNYNAVPHYQWKDLPVISEIRSYLEKKYKVNFNYCAVNLYRDGNDYISWHADKEALGKNKIVSSAVYSVTYGATRTFSFRKNGEKQSISYELEDKTLLIMKEGCQEHYKHTVPKRLRVKDWRINITFRHD